MAFSESEQSKNETGGIVPLYTARVGLLSSALHISCHKLTENQGEIAMPRLLGLCSALAAILLVAIPARADVSWDFIVTAATDLGCPSCPVDPLPAIGGVLTVSDAAFLRGSVSYSHFHFNDDPDDNFFVTGDTDFSLGLSGSFISLPLLPPGVYPGFGEPAIASIELSFSSDGKISGDIFSIWVSGGTNDVTMSIENSIVTDAIWGSDGGALGCGTSRCLIDGYWQLTSPLPQRIPEPSGLAILVGAITSLGIMRRRAVLARLCSA
jgi:hypothetical protein